MSSAIASTVRGWGPVLFVVLYGFTCVQYGTSYYYSTTLVIADE